MFQHKVGSAKNSRENSVESATTPYNNGGISTSNLSSKHQNLKVSHSQFLGQNQKIKFQRIKQLPKDTRFNEDLSERQNDIKSVISLNNRSLGKLHSSNQEYTKTDP